MSANTGRRSVSILVRALLQSGVLSAQCPPLTSANANTGWPSGASENVYFLNTESGTWTGQQSTICCGNGSALYNWNNTLGSGLQISGEGGVNAMPSPLPAHYLEFYLNDAPSCGASACTFVQPANNQTSYTITDMLPSVTTNPAYLQLMAHEIGHTYGAADCTGCDQVDGGFEPLTTMDDRGINANWPTVSHLLRRSTHV